MRVAWTGSALADLDGILAYSAAHFPGSAASIEARIRQIVEQIARWPRSARVVAGLPEIRAAAVPGYPVRIFYRLMEGEIMIVHIRHTSRDQWSGK